MLQPVGGKISLATVLFKMENYMKGLYNNNLKNVELVINMNQDSKDC